MDPTSSLPPSLPSHLNDSTPIADDVTRLSLNYSPLTMVVVATLLTVVIATTAFGNLLVGVALVRYRHLRTTSNILIGNLALSDFLLATTILPLSTLNECLGYWALGRAMCNAWLVTDILYCTASLWNICFIAFDRFTATLFPIWYRERRSIRQAALYVVGVWSVAGAICLPPLFGWTDLEQNYVYDPGYDVTRCIIFQTPGYVLYSACGSFFVPFALTLFLYVQIFVVLRKRFRRMRSRGSSYASNDVPSSSSWKRGVFFRRRLRDMLLGDGGGGGQPEVELTSFVGLTSGFAAADDTTTTSRSFLSSESVSMATVAQTTTVTKRPTLLTVDYVMDDGTTVTSSLTSERSSSVQRPTTHCSPLSSFRLSVFGGSSSSEKRKHSWRPEAEKTDRMRIVAKVIVDSDPQSIHRTQRHRLCCCCCCWPKVKTQPTVTTTMHYGSRDMTSSSLTPAALTLTPSVLRLQRLSRRRFERRETQATVRMAVIIAFFCGMWIGFFVVYVIRGWIPGCFVPREVDAFFFWLGYSNSSVNPILYAIFNDEFRRSFAKILRRRKKNGNKKTPLPGHRL